MSKDNALNMISDQVKNIVFLSLRRKYLKVKKEAQAICDNLVKLSVLIICFFIFAASTWLSVCSFIFVFLMNNHFSTLEAIWVVTLLNLLSVLITYRIMMPVKDALNLTERHQRGG